MQPSLTPAAPCQPTVVTSSRRSYVTAVSASVSERKVSGGTEPGVASWTHCSPSPCFKMAPRCLRFIYLFWVLSGIGVLLGI